MISKLRILFLLAALTFPLAFSATAYAQTTPRGLPFRPSTVAAAKPTSSSRISAPKPSRASTAARS
jgi:hypothetical protein